MSTVARLKRQIVRDLVRENVELIEGRRPRRVRRPNFRPALRVAAVGVLSVGLFGSTQFIASLADLPSPPPAAPEPAVSPVPATLPSSEPVAAAVFPLAVRKIVLDPGHGGSSLGTRTPSGLVDRLNRVFSQFDTLALRLGVEKIKTIGDAYMAATGLPEPQPDQVVIRVRDLVVGFGERIVLDHLSLDVRRGEILGFVGASGSGKSVLMRTIIGLLPKRQGSIQVAGVNLETAEPDEIRAIGRRWGILFQQGALFSSLTVRQNVQFPMRENLTISPRLLS